MPKDKNAKLLRQIRHTRLRKKVAGTPERPRLAVFRSLRHIYAQVIDDTTGRTLVSASSGEAIKENGGPITPKIGLSAVVGKMLAERAQAEGITQVVFDRGGCKFHGRVKALAEASREAGLNF
ncbi:MAG: 50S ribosomal protein L18 [Chloroflexota bacterium]|jgi:large subunit ribosomal protein L18|nr:50S ribosomal protein L18 [Dehalococcoidia bacterium]MED5208877.1 50S ribosomal protein L18 [Chloroflexota bacterium]MEE3014377.1 50S ribosomal protein L18 [Chloroflexota bacterium]GIS94798.1 MAG: 50S ribosomal protein L18 [Dehalococcoidia bacterium]